MKLAVYGRLINKEAIPSVQHLFDILEARNIQFLIYEDYYPHLVNNIKFKRTPVTFNRSNPDVIREIDYLISLGGDGTLLDTVTIVQDSDVPILGINIGRLGFLAGIGKNEIDHCIDSLERGTYTRDKRRLIHVDCNKGNFRSPSLRPERFYNSQKRLFRHDHHSHLYQW